MRITKSFILVFAVAALLAAIPGHAAEKNTFDGNFVPGITIVPPTYTEAGNTSHQRGWETTWFMSTNDERVNGYFRLVGNAQASLISGTGVQWGSLYSCDELGDPLPNGWEGTWNGEIFDLFQWDTMNTIILHGKGENEGLKVEGTWVLTSSSTVIVGVVQDSKKD
jgi:hypothetical protein